MTSVVVGNRATVQDGVFVKCPGCGQWFMGVRGLRSHQSLRFQTMDCKALPNRFTVRRAYGADVKPVGWDVFDGKEWAQRFHSKAAAEDAVRRLSSAPGASAR